MMSYSIYQTKGIILDSLNIGEANKYLYIFTEELGFIGVSAQGLRNVRSKLRYGLQDFSCADVSLVKGKNVWRLTNVAPEENFYSFFRKEKEKLFVVVRVFGLLKRLLRGEEKNKKLFEIISSSINFLKSERLDENFLSNFECILVMRILNNLGYFSEDDIFGNFIGRDDWTKDLLLKFDPSRKLSIERINQSLKETHL